MLVFAIKMDETEIVMRSHWSWFHDHGSAWQWSAMFGTTAALCAFGFLFGGPVRVLSKMCLCVMFGVTSWALYRSAPHGIDLWVYGIFSVFSFQLTFEEGLTRRADRTPRG